MNKTKLLLVQAFFILSGICFFLFLGLGLLEFFGLSEPVSDISRYKLTGIFVCIFIFFIICILGANLLSYIFQASVMKVKRYELEEMINLSAEVDKRENSVLIQKFYKWCLDVAYRNET